jgi:hypothetical protein
MVKYSAEYEFKEGIFLNFSQVKSNKPIPKSRIISSENYNSLDFLNKVVQNDKIYVYDEYGMRQEIATKDVWGFSRKGTLYIHWNNEFNRIPIVGNICHFVANKAINHGNYNDPYYYNPYRYNITVPTTTTVEMQQYILNFESGEVYEYEIKGLEIILMRDPELFDEFNNLRNRKKRKLKFLYLRKFNERNPLYLPKN